MIGLYPMPPYSNTYLILANDVAGIITTIGILLGLILISLAGIFIIKKWWLNQNDSGSDEIGFSLSSLKRLHREGKISDQELEIAKIHVQAQIRKVADRKKEDPLPKQNMGLAEKMNIDHDEFHSQFDKKEPE